VTIIFGVIPNICILYGTKNRRQKMQSIYGTDFCSVCHGYEAFLKTVFPTETTTTSRLTPAMQAGTRFTYPGGMEG